MEASATPRTDFVINSEYEIINHDGTLIEIDWDNVPEDMKNAATAMITIGNAFRNWKSAREGGQFSQAPICWLPSVESKAGHRPSVIAKLTAEFSSKENAFIPNNNDDDVHVGELLGLLNQVIKKTTYYLGVAAGTVLTYEGYVELTLQTAHDNVEQLIASAMEVADLVSQNSTLIRQHETIG